MYLEVIGIVIVLLLVLLFFLSDDKKEYIDFVKEEWRRDKFLGLTKAFVLLFTPVAVYIGYPFYLFTGVFPVGIGERLWNPYIFGGMPAYAVGTGYIWWNLLYIVAHTTRTVIFLNPIGTLLFIGSVYWYFKRRGKLTYSLLIIAEVMMLYFAFWNFGAREL